MRKTEQAGEAAKHTPGMTSTTGNSVYARTVMNAPANEPDIRGLRVTREDLHRSHMRSWPRLPYEAYEAVMVEDHGVIIVEGDA